jgi:hypothetical protein
MAPYFRVSFKYPGKSELRYEVGLSLRPFLIAKAHYTWLAPCYGYLL